MFIVHITVAKIKSNQYLNNLYYVFIFCTITNYEICAVDFHIADCGESREIDTACGITRTK